MNTKEKMEMFAGYRRELALDLNLEVPSNHLVDISDDVKKVAFEKATVEEYSGKAGGREVTVFVLIGNSPIVAKSSYRDWETDRKSTRLNSSHRSLSRMPSSA